MWKVEDVLRDLKEEGIFEENNSEKEGGLPPGFRFHPTDEELITFYLASKVFNITNTNLFLSNYHSGVKILEVDLTRCEPWDLPERAKMGEREWYLYSLRDRKYPSGLRTNRATETGYWKATGKDRQVYATTLSSAATSFGIPLIGMKKTLVFYQGRAPRGLKTKWIMHEYRLDGHFSSFRLSSKEEWVICRIFHKMNAAEKKYTPPQIHHPPSPPPILQPSSPFLSSLPSLSEPPNNPTTTTTQSEVDTLSQPRHHYDLLNSLLINYPLPNFSSISESSNTIFPLPNNDNTIQTTSAVSGDLARFKERCLSSTTITSSTIGGNTTMAVTKQWQQQQQKQQQWVDKIWTAHQNDYFQNQYHHQPLNFNQMMDLPNNDDDDVNGVEQVEMSPSLAVAALDRMLNHTATSINTHHPATESWSFRIHP